MKIIIPVVMAICVTIFTIAAIADTNFVAYKKIYEPATPIITIVKD